ncbi:MAG TPA: radical SAM protein [Hymenobacter sp.]
MKLSQFNTTVSYKDKFFLYNAFSNNFMLIEPLLKELLEAAKLHHNVSDLAEIHPPFYNRLVEDGFIVHPDKDELAAVKELREQVDLLNEEVYILTINPTMNCNFSCWYCYESHIKSSRMEAETVETLIQFIRNVYANNPKLKFFTISWFGGEPLLQYKNVVAPIQTFCKDFFEQRGVTFKAAFTTNGFLLNAEMMKKFKETNVKGFQITLDGHRDFHNTVRFVNSKQGSYDAIVSNILQLCREGFEVELRINYTKVNLASVANILADIEPLEQAYRTNLKIAFRKVWQEKDKTLVPLVQQLAGMFKAGGFRAISGGSPDNVRSSCYADKKNHATVNYNGEVFKCTARNFSSDAKEGDLTADGEINWNQKYYDRLDIKFKNPPCLVCPILPICNGGCSQKALENVGKDYCVFDFDENVKKGVVLDKILGMSNAMA